MWKVAFTARKVEISLNLQLSRFRLVRRDSDMEIYTSSFHLISTNWNAHFEFPMVSNKGNWDFKFPSGRFPLLRFINLEHFATSSLHDHINTLRIAQLGQFFRLLLFTDNYHQHICVWHENPHKILLFLLKSLKAAWPKFEWNIAFKGPPSSSLLSS